MSPEPVRPVEIARPGPGEYAPAFGRYVERVPQGPLLDALARQGLATAELLAGVPAEKGRYRYAPEKWSVMQVVGHVSDCERVFAYRVLWIARGDPAPLPGFEEDEWMRAAPFADRELADVAAELASVRQATLSLLRGLDAAAFARTGTANGAPVSVRALAHIIAGHELHHLSVLRERYGIA